MNSWTNQAIDSIVLELVFQKINSTGHFLVYRRGSSMNFSEHLYRTIKLRSFPSIDLVRTKTTKFWKSIHHHHYGAHFSNFQKAWHKVHGTLCMVFPEKATSPAPIFILSPYFVLVTHKIRSDVCLDVLFHIEPEVASVASAQQCNSSRLPQIACPVRVMRLL